MRPLLWISLAFLLGLVIAQVASLPVSIWVVLVFATLGLGLLWRSLTLALEMVSFARGVTIATMLLVFLFLGAVRYQAAIPVFDASDIGWYNDREHESLVTGWVTEPLDRRDKSSNLQVRATSIDTGEGTDVEVKGSLLATISPDEEYHYGDIVRLRGILETPPEDEVFSYRDYLARQGVYSIMRSAEVTVLPGRSGNFFIRGLYAVKEKALITVYRIFPDPEASLLAGILLGVDNGLPKNLEDDFKNTGTAHIIAISGFNISLITAILLAAFGRLLGRTRGAMFAGAGILLYTLLVGADASVVRAAAMGITALLARHFGRRQDGLNILFVVAAGMNAINPRYIEDVGFQLSFFATLGLILYAEPLAKFAERLLSSFKLQPQTMQKTSHLISDFILLTLAAQITTLPIMAFHFGRLSLISFIANPFILPAQPPVMILGGLAVISGMLLQPLGQLLAFITWPFVSYTIHMVELFGSMPGASIAVNFPPWEVIAWYVVLLGLTYGREPLKEFIQSLKKQNSPIPVWTAIGTLTIIAVLVWQMVLTLPDGRLHVTFLDAGTSDAILIQTPSGDNLLINGGESISKLSSQVGKRLPLFNRKLDWLIVASTQESQVNALPRLMDRYPADQALWAGNVEASYPARALKEWLTSHQVRVTNAEKDQTLDLGSGATLTVVSVDERGAVLLIRYGGFSLLLPVGMKLDTLTELQMDETLPPLTALLLADSGYAQLNPPAWIDFLNPQILILSVASDNKDGLPDEEVLDAVGERTLLRTDVNGWIEISSDGKSLAVEVEKATPAISTPSIPTESTEPPIPTGEPVETEPPIGTEPPVPFPIPSDEPSATEPPIPISPP
jgi:competence protein ComEC